MTIARPALPHGFVVRIDPGCRRSGDPRRLVGGAPLRVLTLSERALTMVGPGGTVTVDDAASGILARRLLDAGVAEPIPPVPSPLHDVTVVIPVRDNQEGLNRLLAAVDGVPVVVVDDGSTVPIRVPTSPLVRLVRAPTSAGPSAARNHGAALVDTELIAFLDSDTVPPPGWLRRVTPHFADPTVAAVAPRIVGLAAPSWRAPVATFADRHSSLDMGPRPGDVHPGGGVPYVPSAALVVRRSSFERSGGFDADLQVAEDVDLCWRLIDHGEGIRYDPAARVAHEHRRSLPALLERRRLYGTGAAELARRHPGRAAPVKLSVTGAFATVGLLSGTRSGLVVATILHARTFGKLRAALPPMPRRSRLAARHTARAVWFGALQGASALLRHYWPVAACAALASPWFLRRLVAIAAAEAVGTWTADLLAEPPRPASIP